MVGEAQASQQAAADHAKEEEAQMQALSAEQAAHAKSRAEAAQLMIQISALESENAQNGRLLSTTQGQL